MATRSGLCVLAAAAMLLLAGCAERFTPQRYSTIYLGQPAAEVRRVLGPPTHRFPDRWMYLHDAPFYRATITFRDGRVAAKRWQDAETGGGGD